MAMSTEKWYLTGPITGYPDGNANMFLAAAVALRSKEYDVVSPIELDSAEVLGETLSIEYGDAYWRALARDIQIVASVYGIILLPEWETSRGARLEAFVGLLAGKQFAVYLPDYMALLRVDADYVRNAIKGNMP
jgi:Domain of unknown function (DUF4406)